MTRKYTSLVSSTLLMLALFACNQPNTSTATQSTTAAPAIPFVEVASPTDGALIAQGEPINLTFSMPKEVGAADSVVVLLNDTPIAKGSVSQTTIPTSSLRMGSQRIRIQAFKQGQVAAEKFLTVNIKAAAPPTLYTYQVVKTLPHDTHAYTQGLTFDGNILYEGTGQRGESNLRMVDLNSGSVSKSVALDDRYFGEGIAIIGENIYQLTWQEQRGFVYNKHTFDKIRDFMYPGEGWGLTSDGQMLFLSDGSNTIRLINPENLAEAGRIEVYDNKGAVTYLNELEYINGEIWANIYMTDTIARIDPQTGRVVGYIDCKGLLPESDRTARTDVLNGIAYNPSTGKIYLTGKYWPKMFEVRVVKK